MAAKKKRDAGQDDPTKARKPAKMKKDDCGDDEDMEMSETGSDSDDGEDKDKPKRGKKMPWMKSKKATKSDDDDEDMDEDEDDDEDDNDDGDMDKGFTADQLDKTLRMLKSAYQSDNVQTARDALFEKAHSGARLSKSERATMQSFIDGDAPDGEEPLSKSASAGLNDEVGNTIEVTDYLEAQHRGLCKSLATLGAGVDDFKKSQEHHNRLQAQVLVEIGNVVKSLVADRMVEQSQPARAPRARGVSAPLEKSFAGRGGDSLDPRVVRDALMGMVQKSYADGKDGMSPGGEDLSKAVTMFESSRQLTSPIAAEVKAYLQASRQAS